MKGEEVIIGGTTAVSSKIPYMCAPGSKDTRLKVINDMVQTEGLVVEIHSKKQLIDNKS